MLFYRLLGLVLLLVWWSVAGCGCGGVSVASVGVVECVWWSVCGGVSVVE